MGTPMCCTARWMLWMFIAAACATADLQEGTSDSLPLMFPSGLLSSDDLAPSAGMTGDATDVLDHRQDPLSQVQDALSQGQAPEEGPMMFPAIAEPPAALPPDIAESDLEATTPFGPDTVPFEIFNSSDPKYIRSMVMPSSARRNKTNICRTGTFAAVARSEYTNAVYPYANIGQFIFSFDGRSFSRCSATQIAADILLTAAHCVYDCRSRRWITRGTFYDRQFGSSYAGFASYRTVAAWSNCDRNNIPVYDFALVRLQSGIPKRSYPLTAFPARDAVRFATQAFSISYPGRTKPGNVPYYSFVSPISARFPTAARVEISLSTEVGSSGSPLFMQTLPTSGSVRFPWSNAILGVTSYEYVGSGAGCPNGFAAFQGPANGYNANYLLSFV